jgi:hypothetical protein
MADDQQQPPDRDSDQPPDAAGQQAPGRPEGTPEPGPPAGSPAPDETRQFPAPPADDETAHLPASGGPRSGDTAILPPVPAWSGRAGVPPPDAIRVPEEVSGYEEPGPSRRWWTPLLLALLALVLLGLLGFGLWLILRQDSNPDPGTPAVTPPAPSTQTSLSSPAAPSPTTSPSTQSVPAQVVVPSLVGMDSDTAQSTLERLGLTVRLVSRPDPAAPPGTVVDTLPPAGSVVREGSRITLVIASAAPSPSPALPSFPTPSPTPSD